MMPATRVSTGVAILGALATSAALADARIESFSPTGFNKDVRQVAVRFSAPMVALGDPVRESPFTIDCAVPGAGRWIDERHWVYDFDYDVPGAVRCRFTLREDVRTYAGEEVDAALGDEGSAYVFDTGGPDILAHEPVFEIDERQVFLLALDAIAAPDSIRRHARCRVTDEESRAVELLEGAARDEVLDALWDNEPGLVRDLVHAVSRHLRSGDEDETRVGALQRIVALRCLGPLPNAGYVDLVWGAGIAGDSGLATTQNDSLKFSVRPEFRAMLKCSETVEDRCLGGVHIAFSALVRRELAANIRLVDGDGNVLPGSMAEEAQVERVSFHVTDQEGSIYQAELLRPLVDVDGRPLANAESFPQTIRMGRPPPSASFGGELLVVESGDGSVAPVLLRGVSGSLEGRRIHLTDDVRIARWMRRILVAQDERDESLPGSPWRESLIGERGHPFVLRIPETTTSSQVSGVPIATPGLHVLEVHLPPADGLPRRYVVGMAMATDLGVHFQRGAESSLVWVTRNSDATPVADAVVRITDGCTGRLLAREVTDADGLAGFSEALPTVECEGRFHYLVSVRKDGDLAVVTSHPPWLSRDVQVHTILDRTLFQPGETVSMKVLVRRRTSNGLMIPEELPATVEAKASHYGTGAEYPQVMDLARNGSAVGSIMLPQTAPLGFYSVDVNFDGDNHGSTGFRVEQFKVGAMRAAVEGPTEPQVNPGSVPLSLSVEYLSGGGAASLPVTVRTALRRWMRYWGDDGPLPEEVRTFSARLDRKGRASVEVGVPDVDRTSTLFVDLDYQDANGQRRTARNHFELWPAGVALRVNQAWAASGGKWVRVEARGIDDAPAADVFVEANAYPRNLENRRLPGGFRTWNDRAPSSSLASCSGTTDAAGVMTCEFPPEVPRSVVVEASARDAAGNVARANAALSFWTMASEALLLEVDDGAFAVGDTVPVRMNLPFAEATALVTVQRDGVLDTVVERLRGPDAVVEIPVRRGYAPNMGVSVLAVRGRTGPRVRNNDLGADGDPGTPDYRRAAVKIPVNLDAHGLAVRVEPGRETYRVRETPSVLIGVDGPDGLPRADAEVTLVAVDEALLHLWPNPTWDVLAAMMIDRSTRIDTTTNLRRGAGLLFGRRSFADMLDLGDIIFDQSFAVGVNASAAPYETVGPVVRRDFDPLLLWRGRLSMGADGTAEIDIPLNDLLTSFRIVAVATAGDDLFGTGEATIRTTQDLIVHAGLPETVRAGDRFDAVFTVRNASDRTRRISVVAQADGLAELSPKRLRLLPGGSGEVSWPVAVPSDTGALAWEITATTRSATDRLAARQTVEPVVPVRVQQATLTHLSEPREFGVKPPAEALPGRGGVRVSLKPSLLGGLDIMREAMARYAYTCIEQKVSTAIALGDERRWHEAMESAQAVIDPDGLVRFFPSHRLIGSPTLTAYLLTIADAAGKTIPEELREEMIDGLQGYLDGRVVRRSAIPSVDEPLRRLTIVAAIARHRAIPADRVEGLDLDVEALPTSGLLDWIDTLARVDPNGRELHRAKAILRARLNLQGTAMEFSTEKRDWLWWLMVSPDGNAARAILSVLDDPEWHTDAPRMIRGLFGRQHRGRWQTTVANAWGAVAAQRFAEVFEADPVTGTSLVGAGDAQRRVEWPDSKAHAGSPAPVNIPWPSAEKLTLDHQGSGTPWGLVQLRAAVPRTEAVRAGYRIERQVEPVLRTDPDVWQRGDVARMELRVTADSDMTWVVVEDPVPPGATILGSGLGGDSYLLSEGRVGDRWPVFTERDFESYRAYFRYVPKGSFTVAYSVRLQHVGRLRTTAGARGGHVHARDVRRRAGSPRVDQVAATHHIPRSLVRRFGPASTRSTRECAAVSIAP